MAVRKQKSRKRSSQTYSERITSTAQLRDGEHYTIWTCVESGKGWAWVKERTFSANGFRGGKAQYLHDIPLSHGMAVVFPEGFDPAAAVRPRKNPAPATEAFKRWFKDSKVVDEQGNPLVVYHGTKNGGFASFDLSASSRRLPGFFFTDDFAMASTYTTRDADPTPPWYSFKTWEELKKAQAKIPELEVVEEVVREEDEEDYAIVRYTVLWDGYEQGSWDTEDGEEEDLLAKVNEKLNRQERTDRPGVMACYLSIQDPLEVDAEGANWDEIKGWGTTNQVVREAKSHGHDGAIIRNVHDSGSVGDAGPSDVYVALKPEQIKSVHNNGTFDPDDVDIRNPGRKPRKNPEEDYRGQHTAPDAESGAPAWDVENVMPDYYEHPEWYRTGSPTDGEAAAVLRKARARPWSVVWVYRAVPKGVKDINPGDWVTTTRGYAKEHIDNALNGKGTILKLRALAGELFTAGDSHLEFGWWPATDEQKLEWLRAQRKARVRSNPARGKKSDWIEVEKCPICRSNPARKPKARGEGQWVDIESISALVDEKVRNFVPPLGTLPLQGGVVSTMFKPGRKDAFGICRYNRVTKACEIHLNGMVWPDLTDAERLDTILHEAAHALDFLYYGSSSHGPRWKQIALSLGCSGNACGGAEESRKLIVAAAKRRGEAPPPTTAEQIAAGEQWNVGNVAIFTSVKGKGKAKTTEEFDVVVKEKGDKGAIVQVLENTGAASPVKVYVPYLSLRPAPQEVHKRYLQALSSKPKLDKPRPGESFSDWQERTGQVRRNPNTKLPKEAVESDLLDAVQQADLAGDQGWTIDDFDVVYVGHKTLSTIRRFEDWGGWIDVDPRDFDGLTKEQRLKQLEDFRGAAWAHRAAGWLEGSKPSIPPVVVIQAPIVSENQLDWQIGDGRGRINLALAMGIKTLPVIEMRWRGR